MNNLIAAATIKARHPRKLNSTTDLYYSKVATRLLSVLYAENKKLDDNDFILHEVAVRIALYFEDVVADAGIWSSFIKKNQQLFGTVLPFGLATEDEYYADEPKVEDVQLLLWLIIQECSPDGEVLSPHSPRFQQTAAALYKVLEDEFEKAPMNESLKAFFQTTPFIDDVYEVRKMLEWVAGDCYLTEGMFSEPCYSNMLETLGGILRLDVDDVRLEYAVRSQAVMLYKTGPLALMAQDWLALMLRQNGSEQQAQWVEDMECLPFDIYKKVKIVDGIVHLLDTKGQEIIFPQSDALDIPFHLDALNAVYAALIKYRGVWHINGLCNWGDYADEWQEKVEKEKRYRTGISDETYAQMMKLSGGSPLFYFRDGQELRQFELDVMKFPAHLIQNSPIDHEQHIVLWAPSAHKDFSLAPDAALWISDPRNPYYDADEARLHSFTLLTDKYLVPGDMLHYLIDHDMLPDLCMPNPDNSGWYYTDNNRQLSKENLSFLCRSLRRDQY